MNLTDVQEIDLKCKESPYVILHLATDMSKWVLASRDYSFSSFCVQVHFVVINFHQHYNSNYVSVLPNLWFPTCARDGWHCVK